MKCHFAQAPYLIYVEILECTDKETDKVPEKLLESSLRFSQSQESVCEHQNINEEFDDTSKQQLPEHHHPSELPGISFVAQSYHSKMVFIVVIIYFANLMVS